MLLYNKTTPSTYDFPSGAYKRVIRTVAYIFLYVTKDLICDQKCLLVGSSVWNKTQFDVMTHTPPPDCDAPRVSDKIM